MKLHLDTDIGGDIDDLCALAMVLNLPEVELIAVTTVAEHQGKRTGYAKYSLALAGRRDIPVAAGADASDGCYRWWPGLPDEAAYWPDPITSSPTPLEDALSLLEHSIEQDAVIAAIGPFTNLARLEKRSPGILRDAKLCLMGGYLSAPRDGFPAWGFDIDYNVQVDVESAQYVMDRANPTLVTLAATAETWLRRAGLVVLKQSGPLGQLVARQAERFARDEQMEAKYGKTCDGLPDDLINFLHDPLACAIASGWNEGVEISQMRVESTIEDGWLRQRVKDDGKLVSVVTRVDGAAFSEFWLRTVAGRATVAHGIE